MAMKKTPFTASCDWIAYFYENAQSAAAERKPPAQVEMPPAIRGAIAASLPAWQLGETSDGRHLRAAARQYAEAQEDPAFLSAVEMFIREEQRHGASLGDWLDAVGIARKKRDLGDSLFRFCRYAIPNYAVWAAVVVMVESMAEIYYAAVRRLTVCPRLKAECERILQDEVKHIHFQCEHLAMTRRRLPWLVRWLLNGAELAFYTVVSVAVWTAHGRLFKAAGVPLRRFVLLAAEKFRFTRRLMDPVRYEFGVRESWQSGSRRSRRLSEMASLWLR
jgi:hypothetical protein